MSELVDNREYLGCFRVRRVDEDQGSVGIDEGESTELIRVKDAMIIAPDHSIYRDQNAGRFNQIDESAKGILPRREATTFFEPESDCPPHQVGYGARVVAHTCRSNKIDLAESVGNRELVEPILSTLTEVDCVSQIDGQLAHRPVSSSPKVWDRSFLVGRSGKEEIPQRNMHCCRERFELFQRRMGLASYPGLVSRESTAYTVVGPASTPSGPTQHLGLNGDAHGHGVPFLIGLRPA